MKITWDNIDGFKITRNGNFRYKNSSVILREGDDCCKICCDPYFTYKSHIKIGKGEYCSSKCVSKPKIINKPNTTCYWCDEPLYVKPSRLKKYDKHFCNHDHHVVS